MKPSPAHLSLIRAWMSEYNGFEINKKEYACCAFLDEADQIKEINLFHAGDRSSCMFYVDTIFATAKKYALNKLLLFHNHPGDEPVSVADIKITKQIIEWAANYELNIVDHLVIMGGGAGYFSLKDMGYMG